MAPVASIAGRKIGPAHPPYIIAEMSGNHLRDADRAELIITEAKRAGADAIKIQTYTPESLAIKISKKELAKHPQWQEKWGWNTGDIFSLYKQVNTPQGKFTDRLFALAHKHKITIFSTPFGVNDVRLLEARYNPPAYKIAALEANFMPMVELIGRTGKPIIINTAVMTKAQIDATLTLLKQVKSGPVILLTGPKLYHATDTAENFGLGRLQALGKFYGNDHVLGTSDHFLRGSFGGTYYQGHEFSTAAILDYGACAIEKHFCGCRSGRPAVAGSQGDVEGSISLVTEELKTLVEFAKLAHAARSGQKISPTAQRELQLIRAKARIGIPPRKLGPSQAEINAHEAEAVRYIYAQRDLPEGHPIRLADLHFSRATHSASKGFRNNTLLPTAILTQILGRPTRRAVAKGDPVFAECVSGRLSMTKPYEPGLFQL